MCCREKKASKNAKYLAYRIKLNKPCEKVYDILGGLESLPRYTYLIKQHKKNKNGFEKFFEEEVRKIYKMLKMLDEFTLI
jgi:hypothetical protein